MWAITSLSCKEVFLDASCMEVEADEVYFYRF